MKSIKLLAGAGVILAGLAVTAIAQQPGMPPGVAPGATPGTGVGQPMPMQPGMGQGMGMQRGGGQGMGMRHQMSDADRAAFMDSRIAGLKAALKLTADQEKNWPAFETALRGAAQDRSAMRETMMKQREAMRAGNQQPDPIGMMRMMANMQTARAQTMVKIADAADPLYKSLDDAQKRRFGMMMRRAVGGMGGHMGGRGDMGGHRGGRH